MLTFGGWFGARKAPTPKALPDGMCVDVRNLRPGRGDLRPWKATLNVATVPSGASSIWRMGKGTANDAQYWLQSVNDLDFVRGLDALDPVERTFYTGESEPRWTSTTLALAGPPYPAAYRTLGVPQPEGAMTATKTAVGGGATETRSWVDTFVNERGEEGMPNTASVQLVAVELGSTVTLNNFVAPPSGAHGVTLRRIYTTVIGTTGDVEFFRIAEIPVGQTSYAHVTSASDSGDTGRILSSTDYLAPPAGLRGLTGLWNGMMAGFLGKSVRICEAYKPHAWPIAYEAILADDVVGLAAFGTTLVALTTGKPVIFSGSKPASLIASMDPVKTSHACVSKRSIQALPDGVGWAAPAGLAWIGADGPRLLTEGVLLLEQWEAMGPSTMLGGQYDGLYFGFYTDAGTPRGFIVNPRAGPDLQALIYLDTGAQATHFDPISGRLYLKNGVNVQRWNAGASLMTASALSKVEHVQQLASYGMGQVIAEDYPVTVSVYADGALRHTVAVANNRPFPIPDGTGLAEDWQVGVSTSAGGMAMVLLAEDAAELERG